MERKFWLVCYDIRDAKRLRRVAKTMERFGMRAQKSVFECWLSNETLKVMRETVANIMDAKTDSVRYYTLCADCREAALITANTATVPLEQFYIV